MPTEWRLNLEILEGMYCDIMTYVKCSLNWLQKIEIMYSPFQTRIPICILLP